MDKLDPLASFPWEYEVKERNHVKTYSFLTILYLFKVNDFSTSQNLRDISEKKSGTYPETHIFFSR